MYLVCFSENYSAFPSLSALPENNKHVSGINQKIFHVSPTSIHDPGSFQQQPRQDESSTKPYSELGDSQELVQLHYEKIIQQEQEKLSLPSYTTLAGSLQHRALIRAASIYASACNEIASTSAPIYFKPV